MTDNINMQQLVKEILALNMRDSRAVENCAAHISTLMQSVLSTIRTYQNSNLTAEEQRDLANSEARAFSQLRHDDLTNEQKKIVRRYTTAHDKCVAKPEEIEEMLTVLMKSVSKSSLKKAHAVLDKLYELSLENENIASLLGENKGAVVTFALNLQSAAMMSNNNMKPSAMGLVFQFDTECSNMRAVLKDYIDTESLRPNHNPLNLQRAKRNDARIESMQSCLHDNQLSCGQRLIEFKGCFDRLSLEKVNNTRVDNARDGFIQRVKNFFSKIKWHFSAAGRAVRGFEAKVMQVGMFGKSAPAVAATDKKESVDSTPTATSPSVRANN